MGMKFLFVVQGEGRGHFMQAIEMKAMLQRHGHQVVACLVGKSQQRRIPKYFYTRMEGVDIDEFYSPNFVATPINKRPSVYLSVVYNVVRLPEYSQSVRFLRRSIKYYAPDVIINFYDVMLGIANVFRPMQLPIFSIGHQFMFLHKDFQFPDKLKVELDSLRVFTRATGIGSCKRLALSFYPMPNDTKRDIVVVPPVLREAVRNIETSQGDYIHGYMLNSGFVEEVQRWHQKHPDVEMHFFWDKTDVPETYELEPGLTMHRIDDDKFLQSMAGCGGYATTSGFESVCEAMYLQKPAMMVPVHIEQECNGYDAAKSGAGVVSHNFDMDKLFDLMQNYVPNVEFRAWCDSAEQRIISEIEQTVKEHHNPWYHRFVARHLFR